MKIKYYLFDEMRKRGVNFYDLTEYDQWVNDATRKELEQFDKNYFGLEFWTWKIYPAPFKDVKTFQFHVVIRNKHKERVLKIIDDYKNGRIDSCECVKLIFKLAVYSCFWV
jgi:hypothetical protein